MGRVAAQPRAAFAATVDPDPRAAADRAAAALAEELGERSPDLLVAFVGAGHAEDAGTVAARCRVRLGPRCLIGTTAEWVVAGSTELEDPQAVAVWAAVLPGAELTPLRYPPPHDDGLSAWPAPPPQASALLAFADPFTFPTDAFLAWVAHDRPDLPVSGGMASAGRAPGQNRLLLDGEAVRDGAVAVALGGHIRLRTLVSQGCRPVGRSYVVTSADRNVIHELGGAPAVDRLRETYEAADAADRRRMETGLHIGIVIDEYKEEFGRGDFLVRGVLGAERGGGGIAVGDVVRVGQAVQFHVRDAESAHEDLRDLLERFAQHATPPAGALLFTCNGRGRRLFDASDHDARLVSGALGGAPLAGFFCAGELGPVGPGNFLHGFTASLLVFDR
jgi:small ligand-binding sensory domain FIST